MVKKTMEHRLVLNSDEDSLLENPMELGYFLIENCQESMNNFNEEKCYGIGITRIINSTSFEEKIIRNFSPCIEQTRAALELLASNAVTPGSLLYVLDDMLGEL